MRREIQNVLICQNQLSKFSGSEIITLELAEHFSSIPGCNVSVFTNYFSEPIKAEFQKLDVNIVTDFDDEMAKIKYDLVWTHHQMIPIRLIKHFNERPDDAKNPYFIFLHMSPYEPYEFPFLTKVEMALADLILFNSEETRDAILAQVSFADIAQRIFPNPAPSKFLCRARAFRPLKNLILVSNHPPDELIAAIQTLKNSHNINCTHIGSDANFKRITEEDLNSCDVAVTIGKTVQYALLSKIPVYCYDHFGGPGYLNDRNFEAARKKNFSGRCQNGKKTAEQIIEELISGYTDAWHWASAFLPRISEFDLTTQLENIFESLQSIRPSIKQRLLHSDLITFEHTQRLLKRQYLMVQTATQQLQSTSERLNAVLNSRTYKTGLRIQTIYHKLTFKNLRFRLLRIWTEFKRVFLMALKASRY